MTHSPPVSVFMTVYNGEQHLNDAIASIQAQTLQDFEFVIVNDGSNDGTAAVLDRIDDPRIRVITEQRLGRARALNVAWRATRGCYVANLDADDCAEPERLAKQLEFLQQHPEVGMLSTDARVIDEERKHEWIARLPTDDASLRHLLVRYCKVTHSSVMMPRLGLERVGGYNEALRVALDHDLWVRLAKQYKLANLPEVLAVRRLHQRRYFRLRSGVTMWDRIRTVMRIRANAWWSFSRRLPELHYVVLEPMFVFPYRNLRRTPSGVDAV